MPKQVCQLRVSHFFSPSFKFMITVQSLPSKFLSIARQPLLLPPFQIHGNGAISISTF